MTAAPAPRPEHGVGCVLTRDAGLLVVLTDDGPVRASYGARMLGEVARDRSREPEPGEWVSLHRWCDGPVTAERLLSRAPARQPEQRLATVLPLRRRP